MSKNRSSNPDRGPQMHEGAHSFDMGYTHQNDNQAANFPEKEQRGNNYKAHQNEINSRDVKKLSRGKFSKIS